MSAAAVGDQGAPRVVLVDDHGLFRSGVRAELGRQVEVVGEALLMAEVDRNAMVQILPRCDSHRAVSLDGMNPRKATPY